MVRFPAGARDLSFLQYVQTGSGADLTSLLFTGYWGAVPQGVQRPQHETDHLPPSSAVVKNEWS